jgi:hypothetical protein
MNSRTFFTKSLIECHKQVVEQFLMAREIAEEKIDTETSGLLAGNAYQLATHLTVQWEFEMRMRQAHDDGPESDAHREKTTADLEHPFTLAPGISPDCVGYIDGHYDGDSDHIGPVILVPGIPGI